MLRKFFKVCRWTLLLSVVAILALLTTSPFYIYDQFNQEIPVARLEFTRTDEFSWTAQLSHGDFCASESYTVFGDQFQLDAGFVKWKGMGVLLGFEPRYRLDRLSGRYSEIDRQNNSENLSHDLAPDVLFDFFTENRVQGSSGWLIDTSYGSSVYQTIDPSQRYTVYATEDGLILRAETAEDFQRENGELVIEITRACGGSPSVIESLSEGLNDFVISKLN